MYKQGGIQILLYRSMSLDKCTHLCNSHCIKIIFVTPERLLVPFPCQSTPPLPGNHCSDLFHHKLVLPVIELHINVFI